MQFAIFKVLIFLFLILQTYYFLIWHLKSFSYFEKQKKKKKINKRIVRFFYCYIIHIQYSIFHLNTNVKMQTIFFFLNLIYIYDILFSLLYYFVLFSIQIHLQMNSILTLNTETNNLVTPKTCTKCIMSAKHRNEEWNKLEIEIV